MSAGRVRQRAIRLDQMRQSRETERCLRCFAAELGIAPETLRAEAINLLERFAEAGVMTIAEKMAFVAEELAMPVDELRRAVDQMAAFC